MKKFKKFESFETSKLDKKALSKFHGGVSNGSPTARIEGKSKYISSDNAKQERKGERAATR